MQADEIAAADLSGLGIPVRRMETIRSLARNVADGAIRFDRPWPEVAEGLRRTPGFGPWTIQYLAIRLGRDADAFPESDLGLIRAAGVQSPRDLSRLAETWRPFRAYGAMWLWMGRPLSTVALEHSLDRSPRRARPV
jgi:3-methyladenine DNA glycosylase/8-oxoguanine DNA glycosylase